MKKNILALDLSGSKFMTGIIDENGKILAKERYLWTALTGLAVMADLISSIKEFRSCHTQECIAIGVTIPGLADQKKGIWIEASFSMIRNLEITKLLEAEFPFPFTLIMMSMPVRLQKKDLAAAGIPEILHGLPYQMELAERCI